MGEGRVIYFCIEFWVHVSLLGAQSFLMLYKHWVSISILNTRKSNSIFSCLKARNPNVSLRICNSTLSICLNARYPNIIYSFVIHFRVHVWIKVDGSFFRKCVLKGFSAKIMTEFRPILMLEILCNTDPEGEFAEAKDEYACRSSQFVLWMVFDKDCKNEKLSKICYQIIF